MVRQAPPLQKVAMRMRLDEASFQLKTTETPIKQIANGLGFSSAAHLTAAFRQHFGITPAVFRHQHAMSREPTSLHVVFPQGDPALTAIPQIRTQFD